MTRVTVRDNGVNDRFRDVSVGLLEEDEGIIHLLSGRSAQIDEEGRRQMRPLTAGNRPGDASVELLEFSSWMNKGKERSCGA